MTCAREATDTVRDADGKVEDTISLDSIQAIVLVDADIVLAPRCPFDVVPVADETFGPFEVDVLDCLAQFLGHDVCEGRGGGCDVRDCEVLLHRDRGKEEREVEDLREGVGERAGWDGKFAIAGYIEGDVEEVAAHRGEGLGLQSG